MAWEGASWMSLITSCYRREKSLNPEPASKEPPGHSSRSSGSPFTIKGVPNSPFSSNLHNFSLMELRIITQNFSRSNFLGEGGFGPVHKGLIDEKMKLGLDPQRVAVKLLDLEGLQGHAEWLTEVIFLGQLKHPNLVKLVGYCCEEENRLLVYEYMAKGSLENHLFKNRYSSCLSWAVRMKIAIGAAKGLAFLHEADRPIIYRDFKAPNILLDADYTAKLSDFGLAKDGPVGDNTHVTTRVMGTHGYAAPEYVMTGHLTAMSDVYSFGVVLLEILTGRRSTDKNRSMREQNLVDWAKPYINDIQKVDRLMDPRLDGMYSTKGAQMAAQLASQCLRDNPKSRPSMSAAVKTLEFVQGFNDVPVGQFEYTVPQSLTRDKKETEATKHEQVKNTEGTESPKVHDDDEKNKKEKSEHKHRRSPGHRHRSTISPVNSETSLQKYFAKAMNSPKHYNGVTKEEVFQDEF